MPRARPAAAVTRQVLAHNTLLATKLYIPPVRPHLVARPRLLERLGQGLSCRLLLVSGAAGFGKTTLLSEWVRAISSGAGEKKRGGISVAWLSLDASDNDPVHFWAYLIAALQTVHADLGAAVQSSLQSSQPPAMEALLTGLINDMAALGAEPLVLVLDDYHIITAPRIQELLLFLVDHLPPSVHLVLSGRADPPWPLARLRASGAMAEVRTDDLRFTEAETAAFLNDAMRLGLSAADVAALDERTEGWAVGLQLAALSLQGRQDAPTFIRAFRGSNRFVLDYLVEQVLSLQPAEVQEFLLRTSILERMNASLCDAIEVGGELQVGEGSAGHKELPTSNFQPGKSNSQDVLDYLERNNLFLIPLDDRRHWYRYHHLFADLLRTRLQESQPERALALHRGASLWYEEQGLISEAVDHALSARDTRLVIQLVEKNAMSLLELGELDTVLGWLRALPAGVEQDQPWLLTAHAWALIYAGQLAEIHPRLRHRFRRRHEPRCRAGP